MNRSAMPRHTYSLYISSSLCMVVLLFSITACNSTANQTSIKPAIQQTTARTTDPTHSSVSTDCPATGKARAAIMPTLLPGNHASVVYLDSDRHDAYGTRTFDILERYDTVTGKKTAIVRVTNASIIDAQVSTNGQWVMYISQQDQNTDYQIQLIRMDGAYLQTLYCFSSTDDTFFWSPNQKLLAFEESSYPNPSSYPLQPGMPLLRLLDLSNGNLQTEQLNDTDTPLYWLDNTRLAIFHEVANPGANTYTTSLYLLDTANGPNQQPSDLQRINGPFTDVSDFSSSIDASRLFFSSCQGSIKILQPPCSINVQPTLGGKVSSIYLSKTLVINMLQVIGSTTLLFIVANQVGDTSQNGLWKIHTDGTGLTHLLTVTNPYTAIFPSHFSSTPWSSVSRDGNMFALQVEANQTTLVVGSMQNNKLITLSSGSDSNWSESGIIGWTTM
ncbi:MAG: TolB-like translocation protein [Ktedonobacteraceae bacterium]